MARFETIYITRPDLEDDSRKAIAEKLKGYITEHKGTVHVEQDWGKQKLGYEIKKQIKGFYTYLGFEGSGDLLREVERALRLNESVIKFMSTSVEGEFDPTFTIAERAPRPMMGGRGRSKGAEPFGRSFDDEEGDNMGKIDAGPEEVGSFSDDHAEPALDKGSDE